MIFTANQMSTFKAQAPRNFARRLVDYVETGFAGRAAHSGDAIPRGAELEQRVRELIETALSLGISKELGVGQFVALGLGYSRHFHEVPRVAAMLTDQAFTPEQNLQRVVNAVIVAEARGA